MSENIIIESNFDNFRIDKVIKILFPDLGLRACRRMIGSRHILLNDIPITPGKRVKSGDKINIFMEDTSDCQLSEMPYLIDENDDFYFVHKPKNLHSVTLSGRYNKSLEDFLDLLCTKSSHNKLSMLQRLDYGTSGIISIAKSEYALQIFRQAEREKKCKKFYIAFLDGIIEKQALVCNSLDCRNKKKTIVLDSISDDIGRWTKIFPLFHFDRKQAVEILKIINKKLDLQDCQELTLAGCEIMRGARHQIRAHAASIGYPLCGDRLYGKSCNGFFLHHGAMITPYFKILSLPAWHLPSNICMIISDWLKSQIKCF